MIVHRLRGDNRVRIARSESTTIYNVLEYGFYGSLGYAIIGPALGLTAGFVGAGFLAGLAASCILFHRSRVAQVYRPIVAPLLCGVFFVTLQALIHNESLLDEYVRAFVTWMLMLIVAQSLSQRLEFLQRFTVAAFVIGLLLLPFLKISSDPSEHGRASLDQTVGLNNSNEFGAWFGFCAVSFLIVGIETRRPIVRTATWLASAGCLYVVGLTVSRGALFATALAGVIAARRLLKRGFLPILFLIMLGGVIYNLGVFQRITAAYEARAGEETGRFLIWPVAMSRFLNSPLTGVGVSHVGTYVPSKHREITPHNAFLFMALASGIIPVTFFMLYCWRTAQSAFSVSATPLTVAPFVLPLYTYCFLIINTSNFPFMSACVVVTMSIVQTADVYARLLRTRMRHDLSRRRAHFVSRLPARQSVARELPWSVARPPVQ
ncbi:MAG: O-antigen ligase family protein [Candidatus Binatia bacterium]